METPKNDLSNKREETEKYQPCTYEGIDAHGNFLFKSGEKIITAQLFNAQLSKEKIDTLDLFLKERTPKVDLRYQEINSKDPFLIKVELKAWNDKSGPVWQDLGEQLIEMRFVEKRNNKSVDL